MIVSLILYLYTAAHSMDQLEMNSAKIRKDISNINKESEDEIDQITDVDILSLFNYIKKWLSELLLKKKEETWATIDPCQTMLTTTPSGKFISLLPYYHLI